MNNIKKMAVAGLACLSMGIVPSALAQDSGNVISGVVLDEDNKPVAGAIVSIPGTQEMTSTDAEGRFFLDKKKGASEIKCSYIGCRDEVRIVNGSTMTIKLVSDIAYRDEMIETGMGRPERKLSYTGALSTVKSNDIEKSTSIGLISALNGKLAGLTIEETGGPTGGGSYFVRGRNSTNDDPILIILDGVPAPTVDLNTIDPMTVESVTIMKDAAAKALYGPKAGQGAIVITTKHGRVGKTQVNVNLSFALDTPTFQPDQVDGLTYAALRNQALQNDGLSLDQTLLGYTQSGQAPNNNWKDMFIKDVTTAQRYSVDVSGGNSRVRYYVNSGFVHTDGIYKVAEKQKFDPSQYYNRFTVVSNVDVSMFDCLTASLNANVRLYRMNAARSGESNIWSTALLTPPTQLGPFNDEGQLITSQQFESPIYGLINRDGSTRRTSSDMNFNFGLNLDMDFITKGLKARGIMGYHSYYTSTVAGAIDYARYIPSADGSWVPYGSHVDGSLSLSKASSTVSFLNAQGTIEYDRTFNGLHSVDAFVNYIAETRNPSSGSAENMLPFDRIQLGGHLKYGFDDRYFIQGDFTYAGSEEFVSGNRFHFSPTVSGAWVASNESFLRDAKWLDLLKFRVSYGALQYSNIPARFIYQTNYRQQNGSGLINALYTAARIMEYRQGNPDLQWEELRQQNYGVDFSFLGAFNLSVDYWRTNQMGVLTMDDMTPLVGGISSSNRPYQNLGKVRNQGVDVEFTYAKTLSNGLSITAKGNLGYNKNEVLKMNELDRTIDGYAYPYRSTGYAIGQQFGYLVDYTNGNGFFNSENELADYGLEYQGRAPRVGDLIYRDLNGDKKIDERDKAPMDGVKSLPNFSLGASVELAYKGIDLYLLLQGNLGSNSICSSSGIWEYNRLGHYSSIHTEAWTPERYAAGLPISFPALSTMASSNHVTNDFFLTGTNFMRVKNLTIGYSLPQKIIDKMHLEKFRVFLTGENLLTFTDLKFKGFDPELSGSTSYPILRRVNLGVNVNF